MSKQKAQDAIQRAGRTGLQGGVAVGIIEMLSAFNLIHWNEAQTGAVLFLATPLIAWIQNVLENRFDVSFLIPKKVPTPAPSDSDTPEVPPAPPSNSIEGAKAKAKNIRPRKPRKKRRR